MRVVAARRAFSARIQARDFYGDARTTDPAVRTEQGDRGILSRVETAISANGASTGRFTSKGAQVHNLNRTPLGGDYGDFEESAIEAINDGCSLDSLHHLGDGEVPSHKLSLLIRPAFIAPIGKTLVKADYSQVEARGLAWLSRSRGGDDLLAAFIVMDRDDGANAPDLYTVTAAGRKRLSQETAGWNRLTAAISAALNTTPEEI